MAAKPIITISNTGANRSISGGNGVDIIDAATMFTAGGTTYKISGGNGADIVNGSNFAEIIWGDDESDTSANGADTLNGGGGNDQIHGGNGADRIAGDLGADLLWGDRGGDTFVYKLESDSSASGGAWSATTGDTIKDFASGDDKLDLSALNAFLTGSGPAKLLWNGSTGTTHGVWASGGIVYADLNGDATADVAIKVEGAVGAMDFVGVNHSPTGVNESLAANEDSSYIGTVANETDPDGDVLTYTLNGPAPAGFALAANGGYTFNAGVAAYQTLAAGATATLIIPYTVSDGLGATGTATLTIVVTGTNDAPVVTGAVTGSATEDGAGATLSALANASDVDIGNSLSVVGVPAALPAGVSYNALTKSFTLDPADAAYQSLAQGASTTVTVAYGVSDGTATTPASVSWTVAGTNDAPTVTGAVTTTLSEDDAPATVALLAGASDIDTGAVIHATAYSVTSGNAAGLSLVGDTVVVNTAAYQYLQSGGAEVVTVSYAVTDEFGGSVAQTATITITGVNDRPVTTDDTGATTENAVVSRDVLANDSDVDDANITLQIGIANTRGAHGLGYASPGSASINGLSVGPDGRSLVFDPNGYTDPLTGVTGFDYLGAGQTTVVLIDYNAVDPHGANSSGGLPAYSTLAVTITGTNDVPTITSVAQAGAVAEDGTLTASGAVTANDLDQNAVLDFTGNASGAYGAFTVASGGGWSYALDNAAAQALSQGQNAVETFTVTVTDDQGASATQVVTITIAGANDAPVATATAAAVLEDGSTAGTLAATDVDGDAATVFAIVGAAPAGFVLTSATAGTWTFDASSYDSLAAGATLPLTVAFTATDSHGASSSSTLTITVTGVNDAPTAGADTASATEDTTVTGSVAGNDGDVDTGAVLTYTLTAPFAGLTLNADGSYSFNAGVAAYQSLGQGVLATYTAGYVVSDGTASATSSLTITVTGVNDAAVIGGASSGAVTEDGTLVATGALTISDIDGAAMFQPATTAGTYGSFAVTTAGVWTYTLNNADADLNTLNAGQQAVETFSVLAADGTPKLVTVTVNGANEGPTLPTTYTGPGVDPNDFDSLGSASTSPISGGGGNDTIYGGPGNDQIDGNNGIDVIYGGSGDDLLRGNNDVDTLYGGSGSDTLVGGNQNDVLIGGYGADTLTGSNNADTFRYLSVRDTNDIITDFSHAEGDRIDVDALGFTSIANANT
ncbi:MAG: VCBS domain-containing protein [Pseudomonadota bacterium]